jgi:hypothetical protein
LPNEIRPIRCYILSVVFPKFIEAPQFLAYLIRP